MSDDHTVPRTAPIKNWVVDLRELGRRAGSMQPLCVTLPSPQRLGTASIAVEAGSPLDLDLRLESVTEGVLVSGTVGARTRGECVRCLDEITGSIEVRLQELYAYPGSSTDTSSDADEVRRVEGDRLDLLPLLRDALVLGLPLHPLCREDCRGLCPGCGGHLVDLPPDHAHGVVDPRWAALRPLLDETPDQPDS